MQLIRMKLPAKHQLHVNLRAGGGGAVVADPLPAPVRN